MALSLFRRIDELKRAESSLEALKVYCRQEIEIAQAKIEQEGYSFEQSLRTDVLEEVLNFIGDHENG